MQVRKWIWLFMIGLLASIWLLACNDSRKVRSASELVCPCRDGLLCETNIYTDALTDSSKTIVRLFDLNGVKIKSYKMKLLEYREGYDEHEIFDAKELPVVDGRAIISNGLLDQFEKPVLWYQDDLTLGYWIPFQTTHKYSIDLTRCPPHK